MTLSHCNTPTSSEDGSSDLDDAPIVSGQNIDTGSVDNDSGDEISYQANQPKTSISFSNDGLIVPSSQISSAAKRLGSYNSQVKQVSLFQTSSQSPVSLDNKKPEAFNKPKRGVTTSSYHATATRVPPTPHRGISMKRAFGSSSSDSPGAIFNNISDNSPAFRGMRSSFGTNNSSAVDKKLSHSSSNKTKSQALATHEPPRKFLRMWAQDVCQDTVPYSVSVAHGQSGCCIDAGLMMARSSRVGFGIHGNLIRLLIHCRIKVPHPK